MSLTTKELEILVDTGVPQETEESVVERYRDLPDATLENMRIHLMANNNWAQHKAQAFMTVWKERIKDPESKIVNLKFPKA